MTNKYRTERDSLGTREVPADAYYGIQTLRAMENFPVSGLRADGSFIRAYVAIKKAACVSNHTAGKMDQKRAKAILQAADEILQGSFHDQFVVDVYQAGAGTSFNMNVNEVIANRALEILGRKKGEYDFLSPNDHVNLSQSTNDTYPTALHLSALEKWSQLKPVLKNLSMSLEAKGKEFYSIVKAGRTHLQDAVPIRLGQEFRAYAVAINRSIKILEKAAEELLDVAIGGSAVGTGLNAAPGYHERIIPELRKITGFPLRSSPDLREAMQSRQAVANLSASLRGLALELTRIANDLRLLSSGPKTGLAELKLPAVQPGSSIMPAKVNPVMAECLNMIAFQVIGNDVTIALAVQAGQLELNVMMPLMAQNLLQSFNILINFLPVFVKKCIDGITADESRCLNYAYNTAALGTVLSPILGYLKTAELIKESLEEDKTIREIVIEKGLLTAAEIDNLLVPQSLSGGVK